MNKFALAVALILVACASNAKPVTFKRGYHPKQVRAVDGDTIVVVFKGGNRTVRAYGYDAPELHVACQHDRAVAAKSWLEQLLADRRFMVKEASSLDKYGRRLGLFMLGTTRVQDILVGAGLAQPYNGKGKRPPWPGC